MKKTVVLAVISVFMAVILAGCTGGKASQPPAVQSAGPAPAGGEKAGQKASGDAAKAQAASDQKGAGSSELKRDSGRYVGQIDSNFIEIKISGVPDSIAARSFMLDEKVKKEFGRYGLKKDDEVTFTYVTNDKKQNVISEIKKIGSAAR